MFSNIRSQWRSAAEQFRDRYFNRVLRHWLARITLTQVNLTADTFIFNTARASKLNFHVLSDFFLSHLIAKNGGSAYVLLDDGILQHWDTVQINRFKGRKLNVMRSPSRRCAVKRSLTRLWDVFSIPNMHLMWYSDFLPEAIVETLSDVDEEYAIASTNRYFEQCALDLSKAEQQAYHRLSRENARVSKAVGRYVVEELKPDIFATSHGIYSTWGPAYHFVKQAGIQTRVYGKHPYRFGGLMIRSEAGTSFDREELEQFLDEKDFSEEQLSVAREYLDSRINHKAVDTKEYFAETLSKNSDDSDKYKSTDYDITIGLFPNIVWDAVGRQSHGVYENVIDWVVDTARVVGEEGRYRLIIRYHPSEATRMHGSVPSHKHIKAAFPEIDEFPNITIIHAEEPVNSYELIRDSIDIALIFTTSFGAEAQVLGVPVAAVASGRFSDRLVHRVRSIPEYHEILKNPVPVIDNFRDNREQIVENVYKYQYFIIEKMFCPLGVMGLSSKSRIATPKDLKDRTLLDQRGVEKTLRRLDVAP